MIQVSPADFRSIEKIEGLFIKNREKYPEYFLLKIGAKKIDSSKRGNVLYGISTHTTLVVQYPSGLVSADVDANGNTSGRILKILCYRDPSTKKTYISFVPGEINKADTAMAWKFNLTRAEYHTLHVEA
jgi:hypothetical protein